MFKADLKQKQPVVYRILSKALKTNRLSHAYLLVGDKNVPKEDTALLLAQSLVCHHKDEDGFACQTCEACLRLQKEESFDLIRIRSTPLKKKDILKIQERFAQTSMETYAFQIYILDHFESCTPEAANTLLKFLEEPHPNILGILMAEDLSQVLDTIVSRTQLIPFKPLDPEGMRASLIQQYGNEEQASMLAHCGYSYESAKAWMENEDFSLLQESAKKYVDHHASLSQIVDLQTKIFYSKSKFKEKEAVRVWLCWILYYIKYNDGSKLSLEQRNEIFLILVEAFERLRRPVDLLLFLDDIHFRIRKAIL
ncbi:hypothetical protein [Dubosiella newyorkensis]|uniref:hypothetical protein n=1 Tax=Dubosiella newyorkensis TaxID=1862672 RepID=UPI00248C0F61|nr:hypothetical protein [Dubosiella newyorkensis]